MPDPGMLIVRVKRCVACKRCMLECAVAHSGSEELAGAMAEASPPQPRVQVKAMGEYTAPYQCRHCDDPPCAKACPADALKKGAGRSPVLLDVEACTGAAKCVKKCPYLGVTMDRDAALALKCDLCVERLERGEIPACAEACPTGALTYKTSDELTEEEIACGSGTLGAALVRRVDVTYEIEAEKCIGCHKCFVVCPAEAIDGERKLPHEVLQERCVKCGACYVSCPVDAVNVI